MFVHFVQKNQYPHYLEKSIETMFNKKKNSTKFGKNFTYFIFDYIVHITQFVPYKFCVLYLMFYCPGQIAFWW